MASRIGLCGLLAVGVGATVWALCMRGGLSGEYDEVGGPGKLEFRGGKVYVGAPLGMTYVAGYEVDGDRVIVKGGGGPQVYTRRGDTLDAGMGMKFVKKTGVQSRAGAEE